MRILTLMVECPDGADQALLTEVLALLAQTPGRLTRLVGASSIDSDRLDSGELAELLNVPVEVRHDQAQSPG